MRVRLVDMLTTPALMRVTATAETQSEAQQLLDSQDFDVLVVDVELRQGNGIGVVKHARSQSFKVGSAPLVIVLTNYALPTVRDRCIAAGADYFLDKMRDFDQLYRLILTHRH